MKILMVISQFHPIIGGAEKQAQLLSQKMIEKGIQVEVVTGWWKLATPRREIISGVRIFRNFSFWGMFGIKGLRPLGALTYMITLGIYLLVHRREYDIIHVHQVLHPAFISVLFGKKFLKKPVLVKNSCSGLTSDIKQLRSYPLGSLQLDYLIKEMECLVTVNFEGKNEFKDIGYPESNVVYIPNGVEVPSEGKFNYNQVLSLLTMARLDRQKGVDVLLKAWEKVVQIGKNLKLTILGNGPQELELKRLSESLKIANSIEFRKAVHDVEKYLREADLFVLPSRAEGLSNSLLEAMSRGVPCIATKVGGNTELLGAESKEIPPGQYIIAKNGVLVNPDDIGGLTEAILFLIRNSKVREEMGKRARIYIQENHSIDAVANKYIALYGRMLRERVQNVRDLRRNRTE
jgi:glycosyltransferase involved in cell wall biosynthesis